MLNEEDTQIENEFEESDEVVMEIDFKKRCFFFYVSVIGDKRILGFELHPDDSKTGFNLKARMPDGKVYEIISGNTWNKHVEQHGCIICDTHVRRVNFRLPVCNDALRLLIKQYKAVLRRVEIKVGD